MIVIRGGSLHGDLQRRKGFSSRYWAAMMNTATIINNHAAQFIGDAGSSCTWGDMRLDTVAEQRYLQHDRLLLGWCRVQEG